MRLNVLLIIIKCVVLIGAKDDNDDNVCLITSNVLDKLILGIYRVSENNIPYCAFLGIPYAQPPIGNLRFQPPEPTDFLYDWVSQYTSPGYQCVFRKDLGITDGNQSEDCLYLNIFVPLNILQSNQSNAVVIWIHGGSYNVGSGLSDMHPTRGPELYIENEVIFVSFNYRLGALGFLRIPKLNITGNYGLMDQRFALKWVHEHIYLWNGDKNNVTLMGWSAGSASASYHLLANESIQYFKRVILMSGTLLNPWAQFNHPEICLRQLRQNLKIKKRDIHRLLTINGTDFDRDLSMFDPSFGITNACFGPTIDHIIVGDTINYEINTNISIMIGWTKLEHQHGILDFITAWRGFKAFNHLKSLGHTEYKVRRLSNYLANEFYNNTGDYLDANSNITVTNATVIFYRLLSKLISDDHMKYGIRKFIKNLESANEDNLTIFVYQFSYDGKFFMIPKFDDGLTGANHGDDVAHMYRTEQNIRGNKTNYDAEYKNELFLQSSLIKMWINFIKHGNPTPIPITSAPNDTARTVIWEDFLRSRKLLDFNLPIEMIPDLDDKFYELLAQIEKCVLDNICFFLDNCGHCV